MKNPNLKKLAIQRIKILFSEAKINPMKANRYVQLARKIGMKVNVPIPKELKRRFCRHCNIYFQSGNCRVRTRNKMLIYYCLNCKKYMKFKLDR